MSVIQHPDGEEEGHFGPAILAAGEAGRGSDSLFVPFRERAFAVIFHRTNYINCESRVKRNFKIKSETTGYVQEGEDYAGFLSATAAPLCLFRVETGL